MEEQLIEQSGTTTARDEAFIARLKQVIKQYGNVNSLAKAAGLSETAVRKWRDGISEPTRGRLILLAQAAGVSVEWLVTGQGSMQLKLDREINDQNDREQILIHSRKHISPLPTIISDLREIDEALSPIDEQSIDSDSAKIYPISSKNMEPALYPGDLCVLDKKDIELPDISDGVYVLNIDGAVVIRRMQRMPNNQVSVTSDNSNFAAANSVVNLSNPPSNFSVVGEVIYVLRRVAGR